MDKPELRESFQQNPEAFEIFKIILGLKECNPDFLVCSEEDARAGKVFLDDTWPTETQVTDAADLAFLSKPTQTPEEKRIREDFNKTLKSISGPYLEAERETWYMQLYEYHLNKHHAVKVADLPCINILASKRGISVTAFLAKIEENIENYKKAFEILGNQQAELDQIGS